jgi:hypothetical protein
MEVIEGNMEKDVSRCQKATRTARPMVEMARSRGIRNVLEEERRSPRPKDRPPTSLKAGQVPWLLELEQQSHPKLHHQGCHLHHETQESGMAHPRHQGQGQNWQGWLRDLCHSLQHS